MSFQSIGARFLLETFNWQNDTTMDNAFVFYLPKQRKEPMDFHLQGQQGPHFKAVNSVQFIQPNSSSLFSCVHSPLPVIQRSKVLNMIPISLDWECLWRRQSLAWHFVCCQYNQPEPDTDHWPEAWLLSPGSSVGRKNSSVWCIITWEKGTCRLMCVARHHLYISEARTYMNVYIYVGCLGENPFGMW